jgi:hypothetical protein
MFMPWRIQCKPPASQPRDAFFFVQSHPIQSSSDGEKGPSNRRNNRIEISKFDMERHVVAQTHSEHIV